MKKTLYIHGAFSAFKPNSEKVIALQKDFTVIGFSYSMEKTFQQNLEELTLFATQQNIDFVTGTSLGGLYASFIAKKLNIHSVLINPCVDPKNTIRSLIGEHTNYTTGKTEIFTEDLANTFPDKIFVNQHSLVCVGLKDSIIDPLNTIELAKIAGATIISNEEADHYWEFFSENENIKSFIS